ncbi:acyclic terpene utilization AtuA family protein [Thioalkalivibrio sp. HK1]|uniref:acyclic terpene utilization AtuA family protein n=1 Tax=Thioalkalivibrio sp. HK1 TaxID=1469245 RepID=UPI00046E96B8|nr:acyclic terpene utilization AtuA family protein [Thioalkalivibrio sp. HK1]
MTRILVPGGALGLGYDRAALARGVEAAPDIIAIDGGSTDSGPAYLGGGRSKYSRASTAAEWAELLAARERAQCPLVIGTAGTCGTDGMVDQLFDITCEILGQRGQGARIARLYCSQSAQRVSKAFAEDRLLALSPAIEIDEESIAACEHIVALAGVEQVGAALAGGADIVIAGRTTDTAVIAALPLMRGDSPGACWHAAKIAECGALCSTRPGSGVVMVEIDDSGFTVRPMAADTRCTVRTVFAHMLYENADPWRLVEPGGILDVSAAEYRAISEGAVRVQGAIWRPTSPYTVKLEGARIVGFQTIVLVIVRDPRYVEGIDRWCASILEKHRQEVLARTDASIEDFDVQLRRVGLDAALGDIEIGSDAKDTTSPRPRPCEIGVMAIVTAATQDLATDIARMLNPLLLHHPLNRKEEMPTFSFPFSPAEIERGTAFEFVFNHAMALDDPMEAFRLEMDDVDAR